MRAVQIPITGPITVIDIAEPTDDDAARFLSDLHAAIGCDSVECVRLADFDAWVDETGLIDAQPLNPRATQLANAYGVDDTLYGVVVILGADPDTGELCGLTDDQVDEITRTAATTAQAMTEIGIKTVILYRGRDRWHLSVLEIPDTLACGDLPHTSPDAPIESAQQDLLDHLRRYWNFTGQLAWQQSKPDWWVAEPVD